MKGEEVVDNTNILRPSEGIFSVQEEGQTFSMAYLSSPGGISKKKSTVSITPTSFGLKSKISKKTNPKKYLKLSV